MYAYIRYTLVKWIAFIAVASVLISPTAFAIEPVTLSAPVPPIASFYPTSTPPQTVVYTATNHVYKQLPMTVSGISGPLTRVPVTDDCGNTLPAGPASCNIGIQIALNTTSSIHQTLKINYDGRAPATRPISLSVIEPLAYVTPAPNATKVLQFPLDTTDGTFSSSPTTTYTSMSQQFDQLTFAIVGGVQYAYVLDQNGFVYQCTIKTDGTFGKCTATPKNPPEWAPHGIAFATVNGTQYAYVTDVNLGDVYRCSLNVGGSFKSCSVIAGSPTNISSFDAPYGITFATVDGVQFAYIADAGPGSGCPGSVYQCALNNDGSFNSCTVIPESSPPGWVPYTVTFTTVNGTQYAYVADNGTSTPGNVYRCTLNNDGSFASCGTTPSTNPVTNWVPSDIAFATLDGTQYAYVANYQGSTEGGMYKCTLNSNGTFNTCTATPSTTPSPWQPVGIAFRF